MRHENIQQNGVAKTKPENTSVHVCAAKVFRRAPTSSGKFMMWFPCVSLESKRQEFIPGILLLQFRKMNGNPKEHI